MAHFYWLQCNICDSEKALESEEELQEHDTVTIPLHLSARLKSVVVTGSLNFYFLRCILFCKQYSQFIF